MRVAVDIDDEACSAVMRRYRMDSVSDAVNFALRTLAAERTELEDARSMRGSGWLGDLDQLRAVRRE